MKYEGPSNTFLTSLNNSQVYPGKQRLGIKSVEREGKNKINKSMLLHSQQPDNFNIKSMNISKIRGPITTKNSINKFRNSLFSKTGRELSRKVPGSVKNSPIKQSFGANPVIPNKLNGVSFRFNRDKNMPIVDQRRKIRLVSLIDSKPINHYITLLGLKEFSKREQDMGGLAGSIQASAGIKEKEHQKNRDVAKILREDLNLQYDEKIGRRYADMKAEKLKNKMNLDIGNVEHDEKEDSFSAIGSAESQIRIRRMSRSKPSHKHENHKIK